MYVGEKGNKFAHIAKQAGVFDHIEFVRAGKLRRYPNDKVLKRIFDIKVHALNVRDAGYTSVGLVQARKIISKYKPDSMFIKGGFVAVPMGIAAAQKKIPYVTHDSDTVPGLANRIISKKAAYHCTGMPPEFYSYPKGKTRFTGTPLSSDYSFVTDEKQKAYKRELGFNPDEQIILVTGGSQGALRLNELLSKGAKELLTKHPKLRIIHQTGGSAGELYASLEPEMRARVATHQFINDMYKYSGAADVIVARCGASTMSELAVQGKACVIVPSPFLAGGHQLKNAKYFTDNKAAVLVDEAQALEKPELLTQAVDHILMEEQARIDLQNNLHALAKPQAAADIAWIVLNVGAKT